MVDVISSGDTVLAYVIRGREQPDSTTFPVPPDVPLQVGLVVYPAGGEVARHEHVPIERRLDRTCEVLVVRSGSCEIDLYDRRRLVATETLEQGDVILLVEGGHGLRMTADTVLLEVKQGPYTGLGEKERF